MRWRLLALCVGIGLHSRVREVSRLLMDDYAVASVFSGALCFLSLFLVVLLNGGLSATVKRHRVAGRLLADGLLLIAGFCWAMLMAQQQLAQRFPRELEGQDFWLIGKVASLVRGQSQTDSETAGGFGNQRSRQFEFEVTAACLRLKPEQCPPNNRLMNGMRVTLSDYGSMPILPGEHWQLRVRLNRPHGFANPGVYDYEAAQFQRGIMARGYIRETSLNQRVAPANWSINAWRTALATGIDTVAVQPNTALTYPGLLKALVIGDREGITDPQWTLFTHTGTNHLVVISGLHVGFIALCAWTLVNAWVRLSARLMLMLPAQQWAALASILAALCYSLMAGFSLPTQRALIMICVVMGSRLLGRATAPADALVLAALLVLMIDPMAVTQAGFWLSFGAVAALFFAFSGVGHVRTQQPAWRQQIAYGWQHWVQPQWVVSAGLLLPLIVWTGQVSIISPLANVLAIPLVSLLVVPSALIGSLALMTGMPGAAYLLLAADQLLHLLLIFLGWLLGETAGIWRPAVPGPDVMVLMALASGVLLAPRGLLPRWLALVMLLPLVRPPDADRPLPGRVWVRFLDVGQGLSVAVHTHQHNLLFDTGPSLGPDYDAGKAVLLPYLRWSRVDKLDVVMVSHWHADHSGGLFSLADAFSINTLISGRGGSGDNMARPPTSIHQVQTCTAGQRWQWDSVEFLILYPPAERAELLARGNLNNTSCVLLISANGQQVLLTGDIELEAERWIVSHWKDTLAANIVQAPHHGSRSSSHTAFVSAVQADWVVVSAGYNNRFDHPHPEIVQRYYDADAQVDTTADSGAVLFELGGEQPLLINRHRELARRFWHSPR